MPSKPHQAAATSPIYCHRRPVSSAGPRAPTASLALGILKYAKYGKKQAKASSSHRVAPATSARAEHDSRLCPCAFVNLQIIRTPRSQTVPGHQSDPSDTSNDPTTRHRTIGTHALRGGGRLPPLTRTLATHTLCRKPRCTIVHTRERSLAVALSRRTLTDERPLKSASLCSAYASGALRGIR